MFYVSSTEYNYSGANAENADVGADEGNGFAIVVNGHSLVHCLHPQLEQR